MNYYTGFRYALGILSGKPLIGPRMANFRILDRCNMNCVFCPTASAYKKMSVNSHLAIDMSTFKGLICDLKRLNTKAVVIAGTGEPFLHRRIWQMITHIRNEGLNCYIFTNGTLLGKSEIIRLGRLGVSGLLISMQAGTEQAYADDQGGKNKKAFKIIRKNLELIKDYRSQGKSMPVVRLSQVVYNKNYFKLYDIIQFASEMGAVGVVFRSLIRYNVSWYLERFEKLKMSDSQKAELIRNIPIYLVSAKKLGVKTNLSILAAQTKGVIPSRCYARFMSTLITSHGDVLPCCNNPPVMGNIKKTPFKDIWLSDAYKQFRKKTRHLNKKVSEVIGCESCALASANDFYYQKWSNPWMLLNFLSQTRQEFFSEVHT